MFVRNSTSIKSSTMQNFEGLLALRAMAILAWFVGIVVGIVVFQLHLPVISLVATIGLWAGFSLVSWFRIRGKTDVNERSFLLQLVVDLVFLTVLLYFSGGSGNPFTMLYLLPLTIAAAVLPARYTWGLAALAVAGYSSLLIVDTPFVHSHAMAHDSFSLHVVGMWLGFVFAAVLIAYFVGKMGSKIRDHEKALATTREQTLRDEHIVALGTLAAGAAHELGTPLGSILIIARELEHELAEASAEQRQQLDILVQQVERCRKTLASLSSSAGQLRAEQGSGVAIDEYLGKVIEEWRAMRPRVEVRCEMHGVQPAPTIIGEKTLSQALINILNNAADASNEPVEVDAKWTEGEIAIEVRDRGDSLSHEVPDNLGKSIFSSKPDGLGLGLFLAHSTIGRLGGFIKLFVRQGGGACTVIRLPLLKLLVTGDHATQH